MTNNIVEKSKEINSDIQSSTTIAEAGVDTVTNFSIFGSKSINEKRQENQQENPC